MEVIAQKRFLKELEKSPPHIQKQFRKLSGLLKGVSKLSEIPSLKKMAGHEEYYRIRLGSWRVGLRYEDGVIKIIHLMTIGPRGDVFKKFPPN